MVDLTLKSNLEYDAPQGMQGSYDAIMKQKAQQNALIDACTFGGGRRRRMRNRTTRLRKMSRPVGGRGGGDVLPPYPNNAPPGHIEVQPLPQGTQSGNTQANNVQNAATYAETVQNADGDKYVATGISPQNGGRMRRTRKKRRRTTKRTKRVRVNAKKRKTRRTRRYRK